MSATTCGSPSTFCSASRARPSEETKKCSTRGPRRGPGGNDRAVNVRFKRCSVATLLSLLLAALSIAVVEAGMRAAALLTRSPSTETSIAATWDCAEGSACRKSDGAACDADDADACDSASDRDSASG